MFLLYIFNPSDALSQNKTINNTAGSFSQFIPESSLKKNKTEKTLNPCSDIPHSRLKVQAYSPSKKRYEESRHATKTLSTYWAQNMIGADLLKQELKKTKPHKKNLVAVFDFFPPYVADSHGISVKNLISGKGDQAVLPEAGHHVREVELRSATVFPDFYEEVERKCGNQHLHHSENFRKCKNKILPSFVNHSMSIGIIGPWDKGYGTKTEWDRWIADNDLNNPKLNSMLLRYLKNKGVLPPKNSKLSKAEIKYFQKGPSLFQTDDPNERHLRYCVVRGYQLNGGFKTQLS